MLQVADCDSIESGEPSESHQGVGRYVGQFGASCW